MNGRYFRQRRGTDVLESLGALPGRPMDFDGCGSGRLGVARDGRKGPPTGVLCRRGRPTCLPATVALRERAHTRVRPYVPFWCPAASAVGAEPRVRPNPSPAPGSHGASDTHKRLFAVQVIEAGPENPDRACLDQEAPEHPKVSRETRKYSCADLVEVEEIRG